MRFTSVVLCVAATLAACNPAKSFPRERRANE